MGAQAADKEDQRAAEEVAQGEGIILEMPGQ